MKMAIHEGPPSDIDRPNSSDGIDVGICRSIIKYSLFNIDIN